jgi:K+/H+ antiporter YhaU regulatory subunit KhtT
LCNACQTRQIMTKQEINNVVFHHEDERKRVSTQQSNGEQCWKVMESREETKAEK